MLRLPGLCLISDAAMQTRDMCLDAARHLRRLKERIEKYGQRRHGLKESVLIEWGTTSDRPRRYEDDARHTL